MIARVAVALRRSPRSRRLTVAAFGVLLGVALGCGSSSTSGPTQPGAGAPNLAGSSGAGSAGVLISGSGAGGSSPGTGGGSAGIGGALINGGASGSNNVSGSGGTEAGGSAGASGAGGASTAMWTMNGEKYALTFGSSYFEVDPMLGGRITSFKAAGEELLADAATTGQPYYWGSTFWPSPQSWALPPTGTNTIATIDNQPYTVQADATSLTLTSALNTAPPAVIVIKKFSADLAKQAVVIDYTVTNGGTVPVTVAPWEVTRVAGGGLTFYAEASPPVLHDQSLTLPPTTLTNGVRWFQHDTSVTKATKFFSDGSQGWVAHAAGALLLIKAWDDIPPSASPAGESEIEIYAVPTYVEVEQQGAQQTLGVGESLHWTVHWYARKLGAPAVAGSADVVTYVQNQIK